MHGFGIAILQTTERVLSNLTVLSLCCMLLLTLEMEQLHRFGTAILQTI